MTRNDKIESLYLYTCEKIPVVPYNKNKQGIEDILGINRNEIYDWLKQSVSTEHKDGKAYSRGEHCGCFIKGKYAGRVEKWMIENYVNNNVQGPLVNYIDSILDGQDDFIKNFRVKGSIGESHFGSQYIHNIERPYVGSYSDPESLLDDTDDDYTQPPVLRSSSRGEDNPIIDAIGGIIGLAVIFFILKSAWNFITETVWPFLVETAWPILLHVILPVIGVVAIIVFIRNRM